MIDFSRSSGGVIVVDDIEFSGILCTETIATTTQSPLSKAARFELQPFPQVAQSFSDSLNCDFETDLCSHWSNDGGSFMYGYIPTAVDFKTTLTGWILFITII